MHRARERIHWPTTDLILTRQAFVQILGVNRERSSLASRGADTGTRARYRHRIREVVNTTEGLRDSLSRSVRDWAAERSEMTSWRGCRMASTSPMTFECAEAQHCRSPTLRVGTETPPATKSEATISAVVVDGCAPLVDTTACRTQRAMHTPPDVSFPQRSVCGRPDMLLVPALVCAALLRR